LHHLFDYVLVPWERVFLLGDVDLLDTERLLSRVASARVRAVPDVSMRLRYFCSPHIRRARSIPLSASWNALQGSPATTRTQQSSTSW